MNKELFAHFYSQGLEIAVGGKGPIQFSEDGEEVLADSFVAHEYAFYFAQQALSDIKGRKNKGWGKMGRIEALFYKVRYHVWEFIKGVFES